MSLEQLGQFTGTDTYWTNSMYPFKYTDGVKYVAENGKAYWLLDAIASWQSESKIKDNFDLGLFQLWTLTVADDKSAILICQRDTDEVAIVEQNIPFTDFPLLNIRFYLVGMNWQKRNGILMLPSEY